MELLIFGFPVWLAWQIGGPWGLFVWFAGLVAALVAVSLTVNRKHPTPTHV